MFSCRSHPRVPRRAFQIAAPGRPDPSTGSIDLQYGSSFGSPQARVNIWSDATRGGPIPGSAICRRLINPVGFDKTKLAAASGFNDGPARSTGLTGSANFQPLDTQAEITGNGVFEIARRRQGCQYETRKSPAAMAGLFCFPGVSIIGRMPGGT